MAKHYPVQRSAQLSSTSENAQVRVLQADQELSKMNRRLMRMGRYYQLKIEQDVVTDQTVEVYVLRDDWAVQKAFQLAYKHYVENVADEAASMSDIQKARWRDFRVNVGYTGSVNQLVAKYHDDTLASSLLTTGEFELAKVVDQSNATRTFTWNPAGGATEYSILGEYDRLADAQQSPSNAAAVGPYENIDDDRNAATYDHLEDDGNDPPYDKNTVNQATPWVRVGVLGFSGTGAQKISTGYFTAPCGIVLLVGNTPTWNSDLLRFEAKAGDYKGVHAPSMLE